MGKDHGGGGIESGIVTGGASEWAATVVDS